jgi:hypothetical protein
MLEKCDNFHFLLWKNVIKVRFGAKCVYMTHSYPGEKQELMQYRKRMTNQAEKITVYSLALLYFRKFRLLINALQVRRRHLN